MTLELVTLELAMLKLAMLGLVTLLRRNAFAHVVRAHAVVGRTVWRHTRPTGRVQLLVKFSE